jgi:hypothetical protein
MSDWLTRVFTTGHEVPLDQMIGRLLLAFALGGVVSLIYWFTRQHESSSSLNFISTLVLLTILIAAVTQVIGDSDARAIGFIGVLFVVRIVRFRTVVEDTRDTAFVVFAVVVGMAVGAGHPLLALTSMAVGGLAAVVLRERSPQGADRWALNVRVAAGATPEAPLQDVFNKHLADVRLVATSTTRQGSALDLTYHVRLRRASTATVFATELNLQAGLQTVEMKRL